MTNLYVFLENVAADDALGECIKAFVCLEERRCESNKDMKRVGLDLNFLSRFAKTRANKLKVCHE